MKKKKRQLLIELGLQTIGGCPMWRLAPTIAVGVDYLEGTWARRVWVVAEWRRGEARRRDRGPDC